VRLLAGIDGCPGGWLAIIALHGPHHHFYRPTTTVIRRFEWLLDGPWPAADVMAADIPIGLSDTGSRMADVLARRLLGPRRSSVFTPPSRPLLEFIAAGRLSGREGYRAANEWSKRNHGHGLQAQAFNIVPKITEVDRSVRALPEGRVFEVHPEVSFAAMNSGRPMVHSKLTREGAVERKALIVEQMGSKIGRLDTPPGAKQDDLYDALAALWTAARISEGKAMRLPVTPDRDSTRLDMAIWF
jgi:predicted RNase H-like nuclease